MVFKKPHRTIKGAHEPCTLGKVCLDKHDYFHSTSYEKNDSEI